jgi:PPM family protein phosphatase
MPQTKPLSAVCAVRTERGQRSRNDDATVARTFSQGPWLGVFAVADGISSHFGGGEAARLVAARAEAAAEAVGTRNDLDPARLARETVAGAMLDLVRLKRSHPMKKDAGTTLTMLFLHEDRGYVYHVGDSRLYRRRDGVWRQVTEDHTIGRRLVLEGSLTEEDYLRSPMRKRLYRYLGRADARVARTVLETSPGDEFLLATDGVFGEGDPLVAADLPRAGYDADAFLERVFDSPGVVGHEDNASAVYAAIR